MPKVLILVPARYGSTRFPGKPLAKINNKPMIQYVVENCQKSGFDYAIVTDNDKIENFIKSIHGNVVRIDDDVPTGSERIALAYQRYFAKENFEFIVNVQGDEPLLKADTIQAIINEHKMSSFDIFTAVKARKSSETDFSNPNIVKCIFSAVSKQCLYFSRASIPFSRENELVKWHQHIGIYSYRTESLLKFVKLSMGSFENVEKLEQLRALENGLTIGAFETKVNLIGVDTPEDISKIEGVLGE